MSAPKLRTLLGSILLGIGIAASVPSGAAVFRGIWDPSFGAPYPDLGWQGSADFFVPDACLLVETDTWFADGACGDMSLLAATIQLYDVSVGNSVILDTVTFAPPPVAPDPVLGVFVQVIGGTATVTGVDTSIFGPQFGSAASAGYEGNLWLEFVSGQMPPPDLFLASVASALDPVFLHACLPEDSEPALCSSPETTSTGADVTFQRIPEPGSIALVLAALTAAWLLRRRPRSSV